MQAVQPYEIFLLYIEISSHSSHYSSSVSHSILEHAVMDVQEDYNPKGHLNKSLVHASKTAGPGRFVSETLGDTINRASNLDDEINITNPVFDIKQGISQTMQILNKSSKIPTNSLTSPSVIRKTNNKDSVLRNTAQSLQVKHTTSQQKENVAQTEAELKIQKKDSIAKTSPSKIVPEKTKYNTSGAVIATKIQADKPKSIECQQGTTGRRSSKEIKFRDQFQEDKKKPVKIEALQKNVLPTMPTSISVTSAAHRIERLTKVIPLGEVVRCTIRVGVAPSTCMHSRHELLFQDSLEFGVIARHDSTRLFGSSLHRIYTDPVQENQIATLQSNYVGSRYQLKDSRQYTSFTHQNSASLMHVSGPSQSSLGLSVEFLPRQKFWDPPNQRMMQIVLENGTILQTKLATYNPRKDTYSLNFGGRANLGSVNNTILVDHNDPGRNVLLIGKVADKTYNLDVSHPLTIVQGMGIFLSCIDFKLATR